MLVESLLLAFWQTQKGWLITKSRRWLAFEVLLWALSLQKITTPLQLDLALGLAYFGACDWRDQLLPANLLEAWCLINIIFWLSAGSWISVLFWLPLLLFFALKQQLGSGDVWVAVTVSWLIGFTASLMWMLTACFAALLQALLTRQTRLPFVWHLHLAFAVTLWLQLPN